MADLSLPRRWVPRGTGVTDSEWSAVLIALFLFSRYIRFELSMGEDRDDRVADMLKN